MRHILIVEDDKDMQEIYRSMFDGEKEYSAEIMGDAEKAFEALKKNNFRAVVLDIIMEPMSGDSFFVHVRNDKKTKNITIVVVSILKQDTLEFLEKLGGFSYLQKPITKERLLKKLEAVTK